MQRMAIYSLLGTEGSSRAQSVRLFEGSPDGLMSAAFTGFNGPFAVSI
jgi:hypothetical protein